jgi:hypothetical protein
MPLAVKMMSQMIQRQKLFEGKLFERSHVIHWRDAVSLSKELPCKRTALIPNVRIESG